MNEEDLKRCDRLIKEQNVGIPSDQILASEVPALLAEVRHLNLQVGGLQKALASVTVGFCRFCNMGGDATKQNHREECAVAALLGAHRT